MYLVLIPSKRRRSSCSFSETSCPTIYSPLASSTSVLPSVVENSRLSRLKKRCLTVVTEGVPDPIPNIHVLFTQSPIAEVSSPKPRFCDGRSCFEEDATAEAVSSRADVVSPIHPILLLCINPKTVSLCSCVYLLPETSKGPGRTRKEAL